MNSLKQEQQRAVIAALVEGNSIRSVERMTGIHRDTIMRLLVRVGNGCQALMDEMMQDLTCKVLQLDEIWAYVGMKQRVATAQGRGRGGWRCLHFRCPGLRHQAGAVLAGRTADLAGYRRVRHRLAFPAGQQTANHCQYRFQAPVPAIRAAWENNVSTRPSARVVAPPWENQGGTPVISWILHYRFLFAHHPGGHRALILHYGGLQRIEQPRAEVRCKVGQHLFIYLLRPPVGQRKPAACDALYLLSMPMVKARRHNGVPQGAARATSRPASPGNDRRRGRNGAPRC